MTVIHKSQVINELSNEIHRLKEKLADMDEKKRMEIAMNEIGPYLRIQQLKDKIVNLQAKLAAALELLDGQFAEDLHRQTGISIERCRELLEIIRA